MVFLIPKPTEGEAEEEAREFTLADVKLREEYAVDKYQDALFDAATPIITIGVVLYGLGKAGQVFNRVFR